MAFSRLVHESESMEEVVQSAAGLAQNDRPLLIVGPAGTGKGLLARSIHYASYRRDEPFVELDCSGLPEDVVEAELFGAPGSDTGSAVGILRLAGRGTALLEEVHTLSVSVQQRLLRAMVRGSAARVLISVSAPARSRDFEEGIDPGLLHLVGEHRLHLPALRDRGRDLVQIANEALLEYGLSRRETPKELAPETVDVLMSHGWPGNVRELLFVIHAAADHCPGAVIGPEDIVIEVRRSELTRDFVPNAIHIPEGGATLKWIEEEAVRITLDLTGGNRSKAARILGISRPTLLKKLRSLEARQRDEASSEHPSAPEVPEFV